MNCARCQALIPEEKIFCPNCGQYHEAALTTVLKSAVEENMTPPPGEKRTIECPNCYSFNYPSDAKCLNCGKRLTSSNL